MIINNKKGFGFVDSGVKILIAIVLGATLLGGIYAVTKDTVMPTTKTRIEEMFNYSGDNTTTEEEGIIFYIDGTKYVAEENMTWKQWIESENNPGLFETNGAYVRLINDNDYQVFLTDHFIVWTDTIAENAEYSLFR